MTFALEADVCYTRDMWPSRRKPEPEPDTVLDSIRDRLEQLESTPPLDPWQPHVDALRAVLESYENRLAAHREQIGVLQGEHLGTMSRIVELEGTVSILETQVKDQTHAISEGIERTARAERRVAATLARARKELADRGYTDPGLEAENKELQLVDGGKREPTGLQPVREDVEPTETDLLTQLRSRGLSR